MAAFRLLFFVLLLGGCCHVSMAQSFSLKEATKIGVPVYDKNHGAMDSWSFPTVGEKLPYFELDNVHYFPKKHVNLNDFKGKWLILDFWFTQCSSCITSFEKMSRFQERFRDRLQIVMVGRVIEEQRNMSLSVTQSLFDKLTLQKKLVLASAYDSTLGVRWKIRSMPRLIIVDPEGVVHSISAGLDLTEKRLSTIINGGKVDLINFSQLQEFEPGFDSDVLYKSIIKRWAKEKFSLIDLPGYISAIKKRGEEKPYILSGIPLKTMYNLAFTGEVQPGKRRGTPLYLNFSHEPILEISDTSLFGTDEESGLPVVFNYALAVPKHQVEEDSIKKMMQQDLSRTFPFDAKVEQRLVPVWRFVSQSRSAQLMATKYSDLGSSYQLGMSGIDVRYFHRSALVGFLTRWLSLKDPIIDETNLPEYIGIKIDADMSNLEAVRSEIRRYGLDIVRSEQSMKVIVISDKRSAIEVGKR